MGGRLEPRIRQRGVAMMKLADVVPVSEEPRCKSKRDKVVQVQQEKAAIEKQISTHLMKTPRKVSLDDEARALLEGRNLEEVIVAPDKTLEELYKRRRVVERALQIATAEFEDARDAYSREVCSKLEPAYRACAQAIADPVVLAVQASAAEREFRGELEDKGIRIYFQPAAFPYLGFDLKNPDQGFAARWLKDARQAGLIR
jgi:hypothetical protein